jgi:hypothetical protein
VQCVTTNLDKEVVPGFLNGKKIFEGFLRNTTLEIITASTRSKIKLASVSNMSNIIKNFLKNLVETRLPKFGLRYKK